MTAEGDRGGAADEVTIYTDGGASPNPGPGGWAAIVLRPGEQPLELSGGEPRTTNNRMELTAALRALESLPPRTRAHLHTDSEYLRQGFTRWLPGWVARGWKRSAGGRVENEDLWRRLASQAAEHHVRWSWVRGHAGDRWNERADELAGAEIRRLRGETAEATASTAPPPDAEIFLKVSCAGSRGGWAALVRGPDGAETRVSGRDPRTSANRLDVLAAAELLEAQPEGARVAVHTGSDYLRHGASRWLAGWRRRGWKTKQGKPVANRDAWERLAAAMARREVLWPRVDGESEELAALETPAREARQGH